MNTVQENLKQIQQDINSAAAKTGRNSEDITLLAVTKYVTIERTEEAVDAGIVDLGENRIEGFLEKQAVIGEKAVWHFIGSLQTRKVKDVINQVDYLHALDRLSLAKEIQKRATKKVKCFVQINVSGEATKSGVSPDETLVFIQKLAEFPAIEVVGLMTMAPNTEKEDVLRSVFSGLRQLRDEVKAAGMLHAPCTFLSMGMSNDYTIAIEEGATHVRVGSALVGPYK
ncbi:YggS family pyridoxal phosphate-dependent enzyme [Terribacillus saccharophilus]|uniref:Pyridoxal phosphate homeostasis protein n=1 Tax=Terribacillus saccharophilus TaxID=361277 RepID=A0A268AA65_9BACI|nr:YggS family pyridoxal phosphate-dependent enzyme [Terribacillus saccharophilus]PAD21012.1 YggS family pyridoxal phosphate-dependent enzyme [Terribacillus saccharophilus]PAF22072.1 YggS family pyridoxal phosphate-dependent enzyme [Terribacillus saccharophilus]PAF38293.1 YggS family pyridoxal phosphate-dependent enzyme [Terribacillus saccharophilus]